MFSTSIPIQFPRRGSINCTLHTVNTLIIGAGAAGLKCAQMLDAYGVHDVAIVVDRLGNGTSNNSGSDKQTYYKMGVFGSEPDSPVDFARSLFQGGMMHGDIAYIEALGSLPSFFDLCKIGVPFPHNSFGAYVGYKTDHDPRQRATSAGPKTSKFMFERLLEQVRKTSTAIFDSHEAVMLLVDGNDVCGAVCIKRKESYQPNFGITVFNASNVVLATGGPGEMYEVSVWPHGQLGSHGLALDIGARANNLTELQFGLAATAFRWNLSGTYQQVIPDYYSTAADGISDKRFFLHDYFDSMSDMATDIFLKGYQWPFHAQRTQNGGSSLIDIAVHHETAAGRRVFMDFMHNPTPAPDMAPFSINGLHDEARDYLLKSGAVQQTPFERLQHMNQQSIDLFAEHGIDLRQPLETAVCAQHCNGGMTCDIWWESNVRHLFPIGEVCGTHGVRPGGSALNSSQVGATRAAQRIAHIYHQPPRSVEAFQKTTAAQLEGVAKFACACLDSSDDLANSFVRKDIQKRMSDNAAFLRNPPDIDRALEEAVELYKTICSNAIKCNSPRELTLAFENKYLALSSIAFLKAIQDYIRHGGGSRGAYMILDSDGPLAVKSKNGCELPHKPENMALRNVIFEVRKKEGTLCDFEFIETPVRPIPEDTSWFETTWNDWNNHRIF
ncbi:MAG: FAD-binding protein [Victivallales bacterium]|nr:FAD-binding protein [Victivallales bacterium]